MAGTEHIEDVDVLVIGGGGGGYPAAFFLDAAGRRVALVDPVGNLGGDCLAEGCIPSKAVREVALLRAHARHHEDMGLTGPGPGMDWAGVLAHKDRVQRRRYAQHRAELGRSGIEVHQGRARVVAPDQVAIEGVDGQVLHRRFRDLIVATGSAPARLDIPGADLAVTSHDLFRLGADLAFPERPVIIGGGYIGVEVASMLEHLGSRPVVLEVTEHLLPGFDPAVAADLANVLGGRVGVHLGVRVTALEQDGHDVVVRCHSADHQFELRADLVVMATGRHPVVPAGMEHLGLPEHGPVTVDAQLRTANPRVYAPGDVNGRTPLFHAAVRQSLVAAHVIAAGGQPVDAMDFDAVPMTVFSDPEVAQVGLGLHAAQERYGDAAVATRYELEVDARAQILEETHGAMELVWDGRSRRLVGAHVLGVDAAQLIAPLAMAVHQGLCAEDLAAVAFPHPMVSEGIAVAARALRP